MSLYGTWGPRYKMDDWRRVWLTGLLLFDTCWSLIASAKFIYPTHLHHLVGYPSLSKLWKLVPDLLSLDSLIESYQWGEYTYSLFPQRVNNRAKSPYSLVHTDVWVPNWVNFVLGIHYFVTLIDDYSRFTWIFLMKHHSELFTIFQSFCTEIKTQFGTHLFVL